MVRNDHRRSVWLSPLLALGAAQAWAGDAAHGRAIVEDRALSACLLCHSGPFPTPHLQGDLGPRLNGVGARLTPDELRARLTDPARFNPDTIMPSYGQVASLPPARSAPGGSSPGESSPGASSPTSSSPASSSPASSSPGLSRGPDHLGAGSGPRDKPGDDGRGNDGRADDRKGSDRREGDRTENNAREPGQPPGMRPLNRVAAAWRGKPILTPEQIEDVVAFLTTLREP